MPSKTQQMLDDAVSHLKSADETMADVIKLVGPCKLRPAKDRFALLMRIVISQQLSTKAAATIYGRLEEAAGGKVTADAIASLEFDDLRAAGISRAKSNCLIGITKAAASGELPLSKLGRMGDDEVSEIICAQKGLGAWSAQMFLMFGLLRMDILPVGDLGFRAAVRDLYRLRKMPDAARIEKIAKPWRPYATIATWYCWRAIDAREEK